MARPRFATADAQLRQRILDAARSEFAAKGYEAASLNRILLTAGLSKGSFYYYFDDKLDLAATVYLEAARPMAEFGEIETPNSVEEFWAEFHRFSFERLRDIDVKRTETELVMRLAHVMLENPELMARLMPLFAGGRARLAAFLQRGVELGAIRSDLPVAVLMQLMQDMKTSLFKSMYPEERLITEDELRSFTELILDMGKRLGAPQPARTATKKGGNVR
jgi:AcrR family transcriptional regulator